MNAKAIIGVIILAILIGVLYVVFEKNFTTEPSLSNSKPSSAQEMTKTPSQVTPTKSSIISLPTPNPTPAPVDESTDLLKEAEGLQMRDYSPYFEQLKDSVSSQ